MMVSKGLSPKNVISVYSLQSVTVIFLGGDTHHTFGLMPCPIITVHGPTKRRPQRKQPSSAHSKILGEPQPVLMESTRAVEGLGAALLAASEPRTRPRLPGAFNMAGRAKEPQRGSRFCHSRSEEWVFLI